MMIKKIFEGISLPVILLISYIAVGFVSGIISGEMNLIVWVGDHKLLLAIISTWIIVKLVKG